MPTISGRLDGHGQPVVDLRIIGALRDATALVDTGYDGEILFYHDQLRDIGVQPIFTHMDRIRLADGTEIPLLVATVVVDWLGEPKPVNVDVVASSPPHDARSLIGCRLLRDALLEVDFPRGEVRISLG
jgi:predicted aspartyl protease